MLPFLAPAWLTVPTISWLLTRVRTMRLALATHSDTHAVEPREVCRDTLAEARRLGIAVRRLDAAEPYLVPEAAA